MHRIAVKIIGWLTGVLLLPQVAEAQTVYPLRYAFADTVLAPEQLGLLRIFSGRDACITYLAQLPATLRNRGYLAASVDEVQADSAGATVQLYLGPAVKWVQLRTPGIPADWLQAAGYRERNFRNQLLDYSAFQLLQTRLLQKLENSGYPFARVQVDSLDWQPAGLTAALTLEQGPLYRIDSIRVFGDVNIRNVFLQRYLEIPNGSVYDQQKLQRISNKLLQLPYLVEEQPWNMNLLGTGSILNLYLKNRKNSQINGIVGFLPATDQLGGNKLQVTGDFNLNLKNGFGLGESLVILFQQIQVQSPRLQLAYQQPFLFGSAFGTDVSFDGFKKDSSFLNIRLQAGVQYAFGGNRNGKVFVQQFITNLDLVDTASIRFSKRLPEQIDQTTTSMGLDYEWWNTDYRFNPRSGFDIRVSGSAGIRRIRPNNSITAIKNPLDPAFDYRSLYDSIQLRAYTFRITTNTARYFRTGRQTTLKTALQAGWVQSPSLFRNELFQLGGFRLLRGFDDESIFASSYAVITTEYRLLIGLNSFLYAFTDAGLVRNQSQFSNSTNRFFGAGGGMAFETKAGIFNVAFAAGVRNDLPLNLRQSKIHFGYLNFF
ncbi:MAG TPA: BamA/TamA family outer membrane protein [Lacibacter sp.]|nr:BamA/TamA family outer membrane protein [Lacibacter sp.]HMO88705.1 BamA/TamA family outer membrane protein [Lacibacter sp.]HMP86591.1 BamA/TamA family outer membrane protein [Lacibacter sp.]